MDFTKISLHQSGIAEAFSALSQMYFPQGTTILAAWPNLAMW